MRPAPDRIETFSSSNVSRKTSCVCLLILFGAAVSAQADPRADAQAAELRCARIADNQAWLDCYYGAAQPMRQLLGLPPAPVEQTRLVPPPDIVTAPHAVTNTSTASRGWFQGVFGSTRSTDATVASRLDSYAFDKRGFFTVSLANGQVWKQLAGDESRAHWRDPAIRYSVVIAADGSGVFWLTVQGNDLHDMYRVHRVY
jgi:hypothetical protein